MRRFYSSLKPTKSKLYSLLSLIFFCFTMHPALAQIEGKWLSADKEGITQIYKVNGKYYGKIVWVKNPNDKNGRPYTDTENPDKTKRTKPLIGLVILKNFTLKNGEWIGGTIYDPNNGRTYDCTIWLSDGKLKVRGYWGLLYQTQTWTRVK